VSFRIPIQYLWYALQLRAAKNSGDIIEVEATEYECSQSILSPVNCSYWFAPPARFTGIT
jgi:hypothetical protein